MAEAKKMFFFGFSHYAVDNYFDAVWDFKFLETPKENFFLTIKKDEEAFSQFQ